MGSRQAALKERSMLVPDFVSHSSSVGRLWLHLSWKVKYCHEIFGSPAIKNRTEKLLWEAAEQLPIRCEEIGIDTHHVHLIMDIGVTSLPQVVKKLKGYTAKKLLSEFPELKRKCFWGSGLWNPSYYFDGIGRDKEELVRYVRNQGMPREQKNLLAFAL